MERILYIAACVVIPLTWGLIVVWCSNRVDGWIRRRRGASDSGNALHDDSTRVEYHI